MGISDTFKKLVGIEEVEDDFDDDFDDYFEDDEEPAKE